MVYKNKKISTFRVQKVEGHLKPTPLAPTFDHSNFESIGVDNLLSPPLLLPSIPNMNDILGASNTKPQILLTLGSNDH